VKRPREPRLRAETLLSGLPDDRRALWATALYAGLRKGELRALTWDAIDLAAGVIRVERSMDASGDIIAPKSKAGRRTVPIPTALRGILRNQRLRNGASRYVFGHDERPHTLEIPARHGFGLHDCRHAYASFMIAAGCNLKTLSAFMGHSSVTVTADRYGHLFPGSEAEAASLLDRYLSGEDAREDAHVSDLS
jgi:integrase